MRFLLAVFLSFQMAAAPIAAEIGETPAFSVKDHLLNELSHREAYDFENTLREQLQLAAREGLNSHLALVEVDDPKFLSLLKNNVRPVFKEKRKGQWQYVSQGNMISFTSADIFEGHIFINGQKLKFRDVPLSEVEKEAEKILQKKTSLLEKIYRESFGIQNAEACELICVTVVAVFALAILGTAVYKMVYEPKQVAKKMNELQKSLENEANACEEAKNDPQKYNDTFNLATSIGNRSLMSSVKSSSEALELAIKKQFEAGERKDDDCYKYLQEIGKMAKIKIGMPTANDVSKKEAGMNVSPVAEAGMKLCDSYNKLGSCMNGFVAAHVDNSDFSVFKDKAKPDQFEYKKRASGASAQ